MFELCDLVADSGKFAKVIYGNGCIYKIPSNDKKVYLTFDDGPIPDTTEWILDILREYNVKATFFLLGKNVQKYPYLLQKIIAQGHSIGNHTFNHLRGFGTSVDEYISDVMKAKELIPSDLFRPPYGRMKPKQYRIIKSKGFKVILWTIVSCDYEQNLNPEIIYNIVRQRIKPGSIIVFHDSYKAEKNMKYALSHLLAEYCDVYNFDRIVL